MATTLREKREGEALFPIFFSQDGSGKYPGLGFSWRGATELPSPLPGYGAGVPGALQKWD